MSPTRDGSFRLFRFWGIDVHLHWSWFVLAIYSISNRVQTYSSPIWGAIEYLAVFLIVLLHEFGHALACRQVGGKSDQVVLWPLGGVAYVNPPQRPGAMLWSIAAGPLVNLLLWPILWGLFHAEGRLWAVDLDRYNFLWNIRWINVGLLTFNLLPIYPLDGGQILRSMLWYPLGRARSLLAATVVGLLGGTMLVGLALWQYMASRAAPANRGGSQQWIWTGLIALYLLSTCWGSFKRARALRKIELLPRREKFACPSCHTAPPVGNYWRCPQCQQAFDPFASDSVCPHCSTALELVTCPDCGEARGHRAWDAGIRDA